MSSLSTILRRPSRKHLFILATMIALAAAVWLAKGHGLRGTVKSMVTAEPGERSVRITACQPKDGAFEVATDVLVSAQVRLGQGTIDPASVNSSTVMLIHTSAQKQVSATVRLTRDGVIQLRPDAPLQVATNYTLCINSGVRHQSGATVVAWVSSFTTVNHADANIGFERVALPTATGAGFTCLQVAPDRKLWATTDDGRFFVLPIKHDGTLGRPAILTALQKHAGEPRLITGFCFDPASTPSYPIVWVCHNDYTFNNAPDFSGKVSRMAGPDLEDACEVVIHLPRSIRDHMTNQPAIGPDGALYFPQGSSSSYGAPDELWGMRQEHLLTATILRLDRDKVTSGRAIDALTPDAGGKYDPYAADAPLTIYARGLRNAYDLCWHSNGHLYVPVNGSSAGGHTPPSAAAPPLRDISTAEDDWLVRIAPGKFHGHPNPLQDHYILNGANPTAGYDIAESCQYPVGTRPDPDYVPPVYSFGKHVSANGIIEYKSHAFGGRLQHKLLVCRYNAGGDIIALSVDNAGNIIADGFGYTGLSNLHNPLDIVEDRDNGNLYVSEYGARRIALFRPANAALVERPNNLTQLNVGATK